MPSADNPIFSDDLDYRSLDAALAKSLRYFRQLPPKKLFPLCGKKVSVNHLRASLVAFRQVLDLEPSAQALGQYVAEEFVVCQAQGGLAQRQLLVTGYYEPLFAASLTPDAQYRSPLYRKPDDLLTRPPKNGGRPRFGRMQDGRFAPYWTRSQIETQNILRGQELLYLRDPVEAFILHVQGSGKVRLPDGSLRSVQYAAKNGREYRSIGKLLVDEGKMRLEEVTLPTILAYLKAHPEERQRIMHHNDSFIFFRWGKDGSQSALGNLGEPLTPGRSVALDQACYPPGALGFLETRKPLVNASGEITGWQPMHRFVLNQDTGSAIKGLGRLDFYWGGGDYAEAAAGSMKQAGRLYFLLKK